MTLYCTAERVRAAALDGALDDATDLDLAAAIAEASDLVDEFTGISFGEQERVLHVLLSSTGRAYLPVPPSTTEPLSIDSVAILGAPEATDLSASDWSFVPAVGQSECYLQVGGYVRCGFNDLVVGAERWNGGYANLRRGRGAQVLAVTGTFGSGPVPPSVATATAMLSVYLLGFPLAGEADGSGALPGVDSLANVSKVSVEGYSVEFARPAPAPVGENLWTTGLAAADRLLARYVRRPSPVAMY